MHTLNDPNVPMFGVLRKRRDRYRKWDTFVLEPFDFFLNNTILLKHDEEKQNIEEFQALNISFVLHK